MEFFLNEDKEPGLMRPVVMHDIEFEPAADQEEMIKKHLDHYRKEVEKTFGGKLVSLDIVIKVRSWSFEKEED